MSEVVNPDFIIAPRDKRKFNPPQHLQQTKQLILYVDFPLLLTDDFKRTNGHLPNDWPSVSDKSKEWYINNFVARDIQFYSEEDGPKGSHMGPFVNNAIAECLFDRLEKV